MMTIKIKKLVKEAVTPKFAREFDAAVDLTAVSITEINKKDFGYVEYGTGLAIEIPEDHVGLLFPRSSISDTGLILANAVGVLDSGYRGEIKFRFKYIPDTAKYKIGDRVGQLIIIPRPKIEFEEVEELTETARSSMGFGSTN